MTESLFSLDDLGVDLTLTTNFELTEGDVYSRLVYLINSMKIELPTWLKYKLPFADQISRPLALQSPLTKAAYRKGETFGEGTIEEVKQCLEQIVTPELKQYDERKKLWGYLGTLSEGLFEENQETWLEDIEGGEQIEKFNSGFLPFDQATRGFYDSILTVAGTPGSGKTSLLLSFMGKLAERFPVWYFQTEIPSKLIHTRIKQIKPTEPFPGSKVFCGNYSSEGILEKIKRNPDPDRIVIYDSPEIKTSGLDPIQYFEKVYQDLVQIKMLSKMVVVTSQTKQGIGWEDLGVYSLSDSAAKARYSDIILYIGRMHDSVLVKTGKNRFGQLGQSLCNYDYETLRLREDALSDLFEV
jgi:hypothetical protein